MNISNIFNKCVKWFITFTYAYFLVIILVEVVRRYVFGASSPWGEMTARYAFVYLTYIAAAEAIRFGTHIRIDLVPRILTPKLNLILKLYTDILILILAAAVIYYSLDMIKIQIQANIVMTAADVNMAYAQAGLPLGWGLIVIRIFQGWLHYFKN